MTSSISEVIISCGSTLTVIAIVHRNTEIFFGKVKKYYLSLLVDQTGLLYFLFINNM